MSRQRINFTKLSRFVIQKYTTYTYESKRNMINNKDMSHHKWKYQPRTMIKEPAVYMVYVCKYCIILKHFLRELERIERKVFSYSPNPQ